MAATILCVSYSGNKLGAAYYQEDIAEIKVLHDTAEDTNYFLLKCLLKSAKPTQVIVNKSQDRGFIRHLCALCNYSIPTDVVNITNTELSKSFCANTTQQISQRNIGTKLNHNNNSSDVINTTILPNNNKNASSDPSSGATATIFERISRTDESNVSKGTNVLNTPQYYRQGEQSGCSASNGDIRASDVVNDDNLNATVLPTTSTVANPENNNEGTADIPKFRPSTPLAGTFVAPSSTPQLHVNVLRATGVEDDDAVNGNDGSKEPVNNDEQQKSDEEFCPALSFFPNFAFSYGESKKRLEKLFSDNVHDSRLLTAFRFDTSAFNMIRALGALLRFLDQQRVGVEFESYEVKTPINIIKTIYLNDLLEVDSTTIMALEIFHSDYNPATFRRKFVFGNAKKEGSSLFALCNICRSTPGRQMLRYWFECPTTNRGVLAARHEAISFFYHDCNLDAGRFLRSTIKDVMSVRGIINRMHAGNVTMNDWKNLYLTLCSLVRMGEYLREREISLKIIADKMSNFGDELVRLANVFTEMINFRESLSECRFVMNRGVDEHLDELKDTYDQLPEMLTNIARAEADELGIESCSVAYVPIIGYLLVIPETYAVPSNSMIQLIFSAEGMSHYKSRRMQKLDEQIGDIKMQIVDIETTVSLRLQRMLVKRASVVLNALEAAATLDAVLALAVVAREYNWVRPKFVEEKIIDVGGGRHPVAELLCKSAAYVSNPILSNEEEGKVKILSGPNASGKSVYLKMVGVLIYLAHVGSFVPADRAIIGPINRIMSRMYTLDSVLDGMSSFANDLKQMSGAIRRSDGSSLIIIDEFGKGTMTEVGLSLLSSCLNYWLEKDSADLCPHLFVSSHFHALRNFLHDSNMVAYKTMDVIRKEDDVLEFQFRLVDGIIDNSYATVTALKMNIPKHVVDRADEIYLHLKVGLSLAELDLPNKEAETRRGLLADKMQSIVEKFHSWEMNEDPRGFLALVNDVLVSEVPNLS